jgi:hypothetical protein
MPNKTISVKNIPQDLWAAFRSKALACGKSVPEFLIEAIQMRLSTPEARK